MKKSIIPALVCALLLSGCGARGIYGDFRAIEELQTVHTLGLDTSGSGVAVTAAVSKAGEEARSAILHRSGESIPPALHSLQDYARRGQLFFAHTRYVLLGRAQAERGFDALLDYTARDPLTRMGASLLVLRTGTVAEALGAIGDGDAVAALLDAVSRDAEGRVTDLRETAVALSEYGAALVCALSAADTRDSLLSEGPALTLIPDGYAIVKDGAAVAYLEDRDAEAADFLRGRPVKVRRVFPAPGGGSVTLEVTCTGADLRCTTENGAAAAEAALKLSATVVEADGVTAPLTEGDVPDALCRALEAQVTEDALRVLEASRRLNADFLALARQLRLQNQTPAEDWLPDAVFRVRAEAALAHGNELRDPLTTGGRP